MHLPFPSARAPLPPLLARALLLLLPLLLLRHLRRRRRSSLAALSARHIWVVGASRGIGRAAAALASAHGASVSLSSRAPAALAAVSAALRAPAAAVVPLDLTAPWAALRAAHAQVTAAAGPVDVLLLVAGVNHAGRPFLELPPADLDAVLHTNLLGPTRLIHIALTHPSARGRRLTVAIVSSLAAYRGVAGASVYGASKAAVSVLAQALRVELYDKPVDIVCVHPGFVDTDMIRGLTHPKPFVVDERRAAKEVLEAVVRGDGHHAFPWIMENVVLRFSRMLPDPVYEFVMARIAR